MTSRKVSLESTMMPLSIVETWNLLWSNWLLVSSSSTKSTRLKDSMQIDQIWYMVGSINGLGSFPSHIVLALGFAKQTALEKVSSGSPWDMWQKPKLLNKRKLIGFLVLAVLMKAAQKMSGTSTYPRTNLWVMRNPIQNSGTGASMSTLDHRYQDTQI